MALMDQQMMSATTAEANGGQIHGGLLLSPHGSGSNGAIATNNLQTAPNPWIPPKSSASSAAGAPDPFAPMT